MAPLARPALFLLLLAALAPLAARADEEFSLPLSPGWNMLSLPLAPGDPSVASIFSDSSVESVWSYDPSDPAAVNGWLLYDPTHPELSTLARVEAGAGYFVEANAAATLEGTGTPYLAPEETPPSRALSAGWNLIGSFIDPGSGSLDIDDALASIGWAGVEYTALYRLTPGLDSFALPSVIDSGAAYWIFTPLPQTYAPSDL